MPTRKSKKVKGRPLPEVLADRVRAHRERLAWTQDDLAEQMALLGFNWNRVTVAEAEGKGRGRRVTVEELLALAMIFGVGVVHLLVADTFETQITEKLSLSPAQLQAVLTVGYGRAGPPELRRMQLEFQRERARTFLERSEGERSEAHVQFEMARKSLADIEAELAVLEQAEETK